MFKWLFGRKRPAFQAVVHELDREIDLFPIAEEVLRLAPEDCGMDALRIAELARRSFFGEYIRVGEYPAGIDREYAKLIVGRVIFWARWQRKAEGYRRSHFKNHVVHTGHEPCPRMQALSGSVVPTEKLERLPLNDCWRSCQCWYGLERLK